VTHVGELRRVDGSRFKASEAADALEAFKVALSFALARWIAPVAPVGIDIAGKPVWQQWAKWRCDPVSTNYLPWWGGHGDDLEHFIDRLLNAWFASEQERDVIRYLAILLIAAHHWGTTIEAKIMLVHSGFDYLSWVNYVLSGKRTRSQHKGPKNGMPEARWHLKELLRAAKIPMRRPANLVALRKYASKEKVRGAPATVTRLRNTLTHPKDAGEPYSIEGVLEGSWFLVTEWAELMLLRRIGYRGKYRPRKDKRMGEQRPGPMGSMTPKHLVDRGLLLGARTLQRVLIALNPSVNAALEPMKLFESVGNCSCDVCSRLGIQSLCLN